MSYAFELSDRLRIVGGEQDHGDKVDLFKENKP